MSSRYASSTVLSFLGLRKIGRIDKDWYHAFWKKGNSFISCCMPSNESSIWESFPFPKGLVNGVEIGYGQSPITRIGIREPSRCVWFPTRERRLLSRTSFFRVWKIFHFLVRKRASGKASGGSVIDPEEKGKLAHTTSTANRYGNGYRPLTSAAYPMDRLE